MRVSYQWLTDYIDLELDPHELADMLTMAGIEVEAIETKYQKLPGIYVGKIINIESHPQADKLQVVQVETGSDLWQIVCGAYNIKEGNLIPVALPGASLPQGDVIEKVEIRGVASEGMLCSSEELGLDFVQEEDGILILENDLAPGQKIEEALNLDDFILVLELTPNRADCLGMIGVAREVAALLNKKVRLPALNIIESSLKINDFVKVDIVDPDCCFQYTARVVKGIKMAPSPLWMQRRLLSAGIRPINNIVDITNYVMWEYGQPQHAFDFGLLEEGVIKVRHAVEGETVITLDGINRNLSPDMLVIADQKNPIGVAGIMGGKSTEISPDTTDVLFEAAHFNPGSIRRTARNLGLISEASQRFERGVDPESVIPALNRASALTAELAGGEIMNGIINEHPIPISPRNVSVPTRKVSAILGKEISVSEIENIFKRLDFSYKLYNGTFKVLVPPRRSDIHRDVDLIEEVARLHGYERIPTSLPAGVLTSGRKSFAERLIGLIRDIVVTCGYYEVITYSFINPKCYDKLHLSESDPRRKFITLQNPLSEDQRAMRTTLIPGLLNVLSYNQNRQVNNQLIFELGSVFIPKELPLRELPIEKGHICLAITGNIPEKNWIETPSNLDFFYLKGTIEVLLERLGINKYTFELTELSGFRPSQAANIIVDSEIIGLIGGIHPDVLGNFELKNEVFMAEMNIDRIISIADIVPQYQSIPRYPAVLRDIAIIISKEIPAGEIETTIKRAGGELIEKVTLFDLYQGEQIPEGCHGLAFAISYRALERTLTDKEINLVHDRIETELENKFNAVLRR